MNLLKSAELKAKAKTKMFGNYKTAIGAYLLMNLSLMVIDLAFTVSLPATTIGSVIGYIVNFLVLLVTGIFEAGNTYFYLCLVCGRPVRSNFVFNGFKQNADKAILIQLCILAMELVCAVPLAVFSIIFTMTFNKIWYIFMGLGAVILAAGMVYINIMFFPAFYLLNDHPSYTVKTNLQESYKLMKGHFGKTLCLFISFIPMELLSLLSLGIGSLWVEPYKNATYTEYFLDIMKNRNA